MKQLKHWQDPVSALLGVGLVVSPWILGFEGELAAMVTMVVVGLALTAVALGATFVPHAAEEWTEGALGLWLLASPWVVGFHGTEAALGCALIAGSTVMALALWVLLTDEDYAGWWNDRTVH